MFLADYNDMSENSNNSSNNEKLNHMSSFNRDSIPRVRSFNSVNFPSPAGSNQYYIATPPQQSNGQGVAFTARPPVPRHQQPSQYVPFPYYYQQQQQQEIFYPPHMQMAPLPQQQPPSAQEFSDTLDPFIVDVLKKQQERIFLLKLEKELTAFINNYQLYRLDLPQMNSYQRLMVHKVAPYFKLSHFFDPVRKSVYLCKNPYTAIPRVPFADHVEPKEKAKDEEPTPVFQIMRRTPSDGKNTSSRRGSPMTSSEQSPADRKNLTYEERKAAYEEARARIFKDLEQSQKKEGDEE